MFKLNFLIIYIFVALILCYECRKKNKDLNDIETPTKCRSDKDCKTAGLGNHYCRNKGPKIRKSECVPKRGIEFIKYEK